jgi:hypothetical protein
VDQEVNEKKKSYLMTYNMQVLLPYEKVNTATDTPENLPSLGEFGCDYTKIQENNFNNDNVAETATGLNERQTCSKLQIDVAPADSSHGKEKENVSYLM